MSTPEFSNSNFRGNLAHPRRRVSLNFFCLSLIAVSRREIFASVDCLPSLSDRLGDFARSSGSHISTQANVLSMPCSSFFWHNQSINQSINLLRSLRGIEVALSIQARGWRIKRMSEKIWWIIITDIRFWIFQIFKSIIYRFFSHLTTKTRIYCVSPLLFKCLNNKRGLDNSRLYEHEKKAKWKILC